MHPNRRLTATQHALIYSDIVCFNIKEDCSARCCFELETPDEGAWRRSFEAAPVFGSKCYSFARPIACNLQWLIDKKVAGILAGHENELVTGRGSADGCVQVIRCVDSYLL